MKSGSTGLPRRTLGGVSLRPAVPRLLGLALLAGWLAACDLPEGGSQAAQPTATAVPTRDPGSGLSPVTASDLPREGQQTLRLIRAGGPFPYSKDGSAFGNRERLLPARGSGGYREYTVPTPGEADRGARRIVCAALTPPDRQCYYTADHYASFRRIAP